MLVARRYFLLVVLTIGGINFVIVFYLVTSSPLYFCCNSYNRSPLKMNAVAHETSSNTENFY